jgi:hypothetical protein
LTKCKNTAVFEKITTTFNVNNKKVVKTFSKGLYFTYADVLNNKTAMAMRL